MLAIKLFLDSDGVFADFDTRCKKIFGRVIPERKDGEFWKDFMGDGGFAELPRMPFYEELEPLLRLPEARVLSGTPREPYAAKASAQKKEWYARHFDLDAEQVITCMSFKKPSYAAKAVEEGFIPILVDDRESARKGWEAAGGIFIHYPRPQSRLDAVAIMQAVEDLSRFAAFWKIVCQGGGVTYLGCGLDSPLYGQLWRKVREDNNRMARVLGRESTNFWLAQKGVQDLLAQCRAEAALEAEAARAAEEAAARAKPLVTGGDLMAMGFKPGPHMGKVLKTLKKAQEGGERNREVLLGMAQEYSIDYS